MMLYPSAVFGTLAAELIRVVGIIPPSRHGLIVRGLDIFLDVEQAPAPSDYWVLEIGTVTGEMEFHPRTQHATPFKGLAKGRNAVAFATPVPYATGEVMALRAYPVGDPEDLSDLQVVVRIEEP